MDAQERKTRHKANGRRLVLDAAMLNSDRAQVKLQRGPACCDNLRRVTRRAVADGYLVADAPEATAQALWAGVYGVASLLIAHPSFPLVVQRKLIDRLLAIPLCGARRRY
ncbi:MAG: hypothetical protein CFK52_01815 [Chloracidobacterium sp. CP2_5A]|nr:MAG: hypothetical protein CFK52_01815 [Chloracidobacterium sp. CP2_5A]